MSTRARESASQRARRRRTDCLPGRPPLIPAWTPEWFGFTDNGMKWLEKKGLEWIKVCAEPGDLLVW
jgi:hypothetical protein